MSAKMNSNFVLSRFLLLLVTTGVCLGSGSCHPKEPCEFAYKLSNKVCTRLTTNAQIQLEYTNKDKKVSSETVCLPCNPKNGTQLVNVSGICNEPSHNNKDVSKNTLTLSWLNDTTQFDLYFHFKKHNQKGHKYWTMNKVELVVDSLKDDYPVNYTTQSVSFIDEIDYYRSYECKSHNTISLSDDDADDGGNGDATLVFTNLRVQAFEFGNATTGEFGKATKCRADVSAYRIVPIAVGVSLAVLIILSLVLYVILRLVRRKKDGYKTLS